MRVGPEAPTGIVLKEDTFAELANPSVASSSFVDVIKEQFTDFFETLA